MKTDKRELRRAAGLRLGELRKGLNYSHAEMAGRFGISTNGYRKNETGEALPGLHNLHRLAEEMDVSMDWLLFGKGPQKYSRKMDQNALQAELESVRSSLAETKSTLADKEAQLSQMYAQSGPFLDLKQDVQGMLADMKNNTILHHEIMLQYLRFKQEKTAPEDEAK